MGSRTPTPSSTVTTTVTTTGDAARLKERRSGFGVRARLWSAFLAITLFAALAAAAALHAFREVGAGLQIVDARAPVTLAALDLERSIERIVAAAPALLATDHPRRRDALGATLAAEIADVRANLRGLRADVSDPLPLAALEPLEPLVVHLGERILALDAIVERRLVVAERIAAARRALFSANAEVERLLAPWLAVIAEELAALGVDVGPPTRTRRGTDPVQLSNLLEQQRSIEGIQRRFSTLVDTMSEASTSARAERLPVLDFRARLALDDLVRATGRLDPRLRRLFRRQLERVRDLVHGAQSITDARLADLRSLQAGRRQVAALRESSHRLGVAVDRLGRAAERDIGVAITTALDVQQRSSQTLVVLVGFGLLTSALIAWLYVGRSVVRRLGALGDAMLAIAGGELDTPVVTSGRDEIATMGRAVDVFRRNTIERDALLERQARAAERLEQEVERRTKELQAANAFKARFLAAASHDLRQPLHALNLFVAQLRDTSDTEAHPLLVERIDASLESMNGLLDALLDMARLESGSFAPCQSEFPLDRVLERLERTFCETARASGLRLRVVQSRLWVRSDPMLLERILINLVANAVRYTDHGGVIIGCRRRGSRVRLDICDSGPGIPLERRHEIFDEFHQLDAGRASHADGLGLGLAIVDRLSRQLEHVVEVDSRVGCGSRFSVFLPRAASRIALPPPRPSTPIADPVRGKLVLVIDDDEPVLESMRGTLDRWGCTVLAARSADDAVACLLATGGRPPDLIVSDYRLGDAATGVDVIAHLRGSVAPVDVAALLVSGDTTSEPRRAAAAADLPLLHKPITPMALRAMLNRLLGTSIASVPSNTQPGLGGATVAVDAGQTATPPPR